MICGNFNKERKHKMSKHKNTESRTYEFQTRTVEGLVKCEISVNLSYKNDLLDKPVFLCSGKFSRYGRCRKHINGDIMEMAHSYLKGDKTFDIIYDMWKKYNFNDHHPGTPEQEQALKEAVRDGKLRSLAVQDYYDACEYLKSINMYEVEYEGKSHKYGTDWLYKSIPSYDFEIIKKLVK